MITLVLGGTRSGKSDVAEALVTDLAASQGSAVTYVATARSERADADFVARIEAHRVRRPADWATVEAGDDLAGVVAGLDGIVLVDSLATWVAGVADFACDVDALVAALQERGGHTVLVSDEVGLGVHPPTEMGRMFADALGALNRRVAAVAAEAVFVVAGRVIRLDTA